MTAQLTDARWRDLIQRHLDGIASHQEVKTLSSQLESCSETRLLYLRMQHIHASLLTDDFDEQPIGSTEQRVLELISQLEQTKVTLQTRRQLLTVTSIAAAIFLMVSIWFILSNRSADIIEVTKIQGSVRWTGDGGNVIEDLRAGQRLTGGTLETTSVDSLALLTFHDGTTVSTAGNSAVTVAGNGQKKLHLRSGVLSADVQRQPKKQPMLVLTPTARLEVIGTRFDIVANADGAKLSVREGLVRAVRTSDGQSVSVPAGHSTIATTDVENELRSRSHNEAIHAWTANLVQDHKPGEGEYVSAMLALRLRIRDALTNGKLTRQQIPSVYGPQLAAATEADGELKAQPKQIKQGKFGNLIHIASLYVNRNQPKSIVLTEKSIFRVQGTVAVKSEIHIGIGAFGTTRAGAGRFLTSHTVVGDFDLKIPVAQLQAFRGRGSYGSPVGMELFSWFCFTSNPKSELSISAVTLTPALD